MPSGQARPGPACMDSHSPHNIHTVPPNHKLPHNPPTYLSTNSIPTTPLPPAIHPQTPSPPTLTSSFPKSPYKSHTLCAQPPDRMRQDLLAGAAASGATATLQPCAMPTPVLRHASPACGGSWSWSQELLVGCDREGMKVAAGVCVREKMGVGVWESSG